MNSNRTSSSQGKVIAGLILIAVGVMFLLRQMGYIFHSWVFTWPMILIVVGLLNGAKHGFRHGGWLIPIGIGLVFLLDQIYPVYHLTRYAWPFFIIGAGLFMIFSRRRSKFDRQNTWQRHPDYNSRAILQDPTPENTLNHHPKPYIGDTNTTQIPNTALPEFVDINAVLGGVKRNIFSKNVTGVDLNAFMGGVELNFSQADIQGRVFMDVNLIMGGCKLIVPSNWEVISEITAVLGGIEDRRHMAPTIHQANAKVLVLKGVALLGGIEIQSYI
jgi:predicted membrane protein